LADSSSDTINSINIQAGGILTAGAGTQLTSKGSSGAWSNVGTFNAGTSKIFLIMEFLLKLLLLPE
jgi:hypothetical protein